jgi:excisionase family DNA binding protein
MRYLTTGQVARACQVSVVAVKKWIRGGKLRAFRTPGGHFRIAADEFERFRAAHRFPPEGDEPARILVVDDDPQIVEALLLVLRDLRPSPKLEAASSGYEGLLKVGTFRPHVLVLDLRMPGLDGFEVCRRIKHDPVTRPTRVLAITAYPEESTKEDVLRCGADAFLAKPFMSKEVKAQVQRLLRLGA